MKKLSQDFYSKMFLVSAFWNIFASSFNMLFFNVQFAYSTGADAPLNNFYTAFYGKIVMLFVFLFGVGYYIVSRDVTRNRGIVWLGASAKIALCVIYAYCFLIDKVTLTGFLMINTDFVWAMLFFLFLWQTRDDVLVKTTI